MVGGGGLAVLALLMFPAADTAAADSTALPLLAMSRVPGKGPWSAGFVGKVFTNRQCPDLHNTGSNYTPASCQALCDVRRPSPTPA